MSGERVPTPEQEAAISAVGRDVLVEAGAGTGKTGVMVDRYCGLVCDQGVPLDEVLAFTFTDKAAAELRERIRAGVEARAEAGSDKARALLGELGSAWVMTIHGFCNRLLSAHPVAVGIDPRFRVLDAPEADRAADEAFDEALEQFLADGDREREETVAAFGIPALREVVGGVHAELRSRGIAEPRLPDPPASDLGGAVRRAAEAAESTLAEIKETDRYRELVERAATVLRETAEGIEVPDLDVLTSIQSGSKAGSMAAYCAAVDAAVLATAEAGEGGRAYRHIGKLLELFSKRFATSKDRRAGVDFEDLQLLATQLLEQTELGAAYSGRFQHLMVDEFQDTNRSQMRLIKALRGPATTVMMVGDELQSIYGFRHADLEVFREQRERVAADPGSKAIELSGNFRSRPEVVGAVNMIGARLLGEDYRDLRAGTTPPSPSPPGEGPAVEILLTGRRGWDEEGIALEPATDARTPPDQLAEARFVASRLRALADAGVDRGGMVVLLRAFTHLDAYEDSLDRAGLRPYVVGGRGYWSQQQVGDVCALLATIANPRDDRALFGALASPACGVDPDTLWLLRAAAGGARPIWAAVAAAAGDDEVELPGREALSDIPGDQRELLRRFNEVMSGLRGRAAFLPLAELIDVAVTETGYDLSVLMRGAGEARFANVRKLMRLASDYEATEGRDLRGLLDYLAARAESDADAAAATAVEGHDGVRIMTIHSAKGLEFDVVAVPGLARSLLGSWQPPFMIGREPNSPRVGLQLRRLGAPVINLYSQVELREEAKQREAEEELRLFHVAATRARQRLLISGVIKEKPGDESTGTSVIERISSGLELDRESDSTVLVPAPIAREGLDAVFAPSEIAVRVSLASVERAAELTSLRRGAEPSPDPGRGPAPLLEIPPAGPPNWPLSYSAISAGEKHEPLAPVLADTQGEEVRIPRPDAGAARGTAVHSLIEWSHANGWVEPPPELVSRHALAAGLDDTDAADSEELLAPLQAWLGSALFAERVRNAASVRAEVEILLRISGSLVRGAIDLLVEDAGRAPLIVDFKTDRLGGHAPADLMERYGIQRDIYALAVSDATGSTEVEVAYVFLERPEEPVTETLGSDEIAAGRERLEGAIGRVRQAA